MAVPQPVSTTTTLSEGRETLGGRHDPRDNHNHLGPVALRSKCGHDCNVIESQLGPNAKTKEKASNRSDPTKTHHDPGVMTTPGKIGYSTWCWARSSLRKF